MIDEVISDNLELNIAIKVLLRNLFVVSLNLNLGSTFTDEYYKIIKFNKKIYNSELDILLNNNNLALEELNNIIKITNELIVKINKSEMEKNYEQLNMFPQTDEFSWTEFLAREKEKEYFTVLMEKVDNSYKNSIIYPERKDMFKAFELTPFNNVKVIILGQDPYHDGNADGLAFSCKIKESPSLRNILKAFDVYSKLELKPSMNLSYLAKQGVFLINTILTVEKGKPKSHENFGWDDFVKNALKCLVSDEKSKVFILFGKSAEKLFKSVINENKYNLEHIKIIVTEHPQAANYKGTSWNFENCFEEANNYLKEKGRIQINWSNI